MSDTVAMIITDVGRQAAIDADAGGLQLVLTHIGVGDGTTAPTVASTALESERDRVEILSWSALDSATLIVEGLALPTASYRAHEIGVFTEDGTLFAIGFNALGIRDVWPGARMPVRFEFQLADVPAELITVNADMTFDLAFSGPIVTLITSVADLTRRQIDQEIRLRALEGRPTAGMELV